MLYCCPRAHSSLITFISATLFVVGISGCGLIREKPPSKIDEMDLVGKEIPPEQAGEILGEVGDSFLYGPSLGETMTNVGVAILFPPYALYLVGNAILSVSGYEPVTVSSFLPEEEGKEWGDTVDTVMSGPGRMVAAIAGHEARSREVTEENMRQILTKLPTTNLPSNTLPSNGSVLTKAPAKAPAMGGELASVNPEVPTLMPAIGQGNLKR